MNSSTFSMFLNIFAEKAISAVDRKHFYKSFWLSNEVKVVDLLK
jgi:hypothetical protein